MYVKVRTIDGKSERTFDISKLINIEDFKVSKLNQRSQKKNH